MATPRRLALVLGTGDTFSVPIVGQLNVFVDPMTGLAVAKPVALQPQPFRSKEIVVALQTRDRRVKVFRIDWLKAEVGVSIGLRYFSPSHAIIGRYALRVLPGAQSSVSLLEGGKLTQEPIKLSYHRSGEALFSSTGKIQSEFRTNSTPLVGKSGHLFSAHIRGPDGFEPTEAKDDVPPSKRRTVLTMKFDQSGDVDLEVIGWWYPLASLRIERPAPDYSAAQAPLHLRTDDGSFVDGVLVAPPLDWPWDGYALFLSATPFAITPGHAHPYMLVTGGFGQLSEPDNPDAGIAFLGAMYTDHSAEIADLTRLLGTVDLVRQ